MKNTTESTSLFNPEFSFEPQDSFSFNSSSKNEQNNLGNLSATKQNKNHNHQQQQDNDEEEDEFKQTSKELEFLTKKEGILLLMFFSSIYLLKIV